MVPMWRRCENASTRRLLSNSRPARFRGRLAVCLLLRLQAGSAAFDHILTQLAHGPGRDVDALASFNRCLRLIEAGPQFGQSCRLPAKRLCNRFSPGVVGPAKAERTSPGSLGHIGDVESAIVHHLKFKDALHFSSNSLKRSNVYNTFINLKFLSTSSTYHYQLVEIVKGFFLYLLANALNFRFKSGVDLSIITHSRIFPAMTAVSLRPNKFTLRINLSAAAHSFRKLSLWRRPKTRFYVPSDSYFGCCHFNFAYYINQMVY
jgi:hypothetical protein